MTETRIIKKIEIPEYPLNVPLTKGRRAKKNAEGKVTNTRWLTVPRVKRLNGQDLWSGMNPQLRSKMAKYLKLYMYDTIKDIEPITSFPIGIDMEFHFPLNENENKDPDLDNMVIWYRKCFSDA